MATKPTLVMHLDCSDAMWRFQMDNLERRLKLELEAEAERIKTAPAVPTTPIVPPWWARMVPGVD